MDHPANIRSPLHPGAAPLGAALAVRLGRAPLAGRAVELAALRAEIDAAFAGAPRLALLTGEAGIGKTRVLDETLAYARARNPAARRVVGRCVDERSPPPYLPWAGALAALDLPADHPEAAAVVAVLARFEGRAPPRAGGQHLTPEQRKFRLFDEVVRLTARLAREQPLVVALDDLQWADAASAELLRHLLVHAPAVPLLVVAACRGEEIPANPALGRALEDLDRHRLLTPIPLAPLAPADTARLVAELAPWAEPSPELAAAIHRHCEGNPFFVEEVVRALAMDGVLAPDAPAAPAARLDVLPLPRGVAAVIERRAARLDPASRDLLDIAALLGREIDAAALAAVTGIEEARVAEMLGDAARAALICPTPPGPPGAPPADFVFLHDRVREALAAGINPARRRAIHARIAAMLAEGPPDDLTRLAAHTDHLLLAGRPRDAAATAVRLGDLAMRAHAHEAAGRAYRLAVDAAPTGVAEHSPGDLLLRLGEAALASGARDWAELLQAAERRYAEAGDRHGAARALRRLGAGYARRESFALAVGCLEAALPALDELRASEPTGQAGEIVAEMAEALLELGGVYGLSLGRPDDAIACGERALALAAEAEAGPGIAARARLVLASALLRAARLEEGRAMLAQALPAALAANDPALAAEILGAKANHHYWTGDLDASWRAAEERRRFGLLGGDPYALRHPRSWQALLAITRGRWDEAEQLLAEAEVDVERVESGEPRSFLTQVRGVMLLVRGRFPEAVATLAEAMAGFRPSGAGAVVWYAGVLATACELAGDAAGADAAIRETEEALAAQPAGALPRAPAVAHLGILAALRGDVAAADRLYPELRPFAGQLHWVLVDRVLGMLAALQGDLPGAEVHFAAAAALARRGGLVPELALTMAERGVALGRAADPARRAEGAAAAREGRALLLRLGMDWAAVLAAERFGAARPPRPLPAGLSAREAEALALVAEGLTNRQIAERLGISAKTVANHLTHIFDKTGAENRAAATAFAVRHGLAGAAPRDLDRELDFELDQE